MDIRTNSAERINEGMVLSHVKLLEEYKSVLENAMNDTTYSTSESVLHTPFDTASFEEVRTVCLPLAKKCKLVLLVGIGGSDLGTRAVYDALRGYREKYAKKDGAQLLTFSTIQPQIFKDIASILKGHHNIEDVVLVVVSKSGTTTETLVNANILFSLFTERFKDKDVTKHVFVIADGDTELATQAKEKGFNFFAIPKKVGGRFSVFTPVGTVPLSLLGFTVDSFLEGARKGIQASVTKGKGSSAAVSASFLFEAYLSIEVRVHELFIFNPELETLGKWYRQLLAESIGKERSDGTAIGITPTIALGTEDLHSVGQLIFGGRNDRFTTFLACKSAWESEECVHAQDESIFSLPILQNKKASTVLSVIYESVQNAYNLHALPHITTEFSEINEREIGVWMGIHMTAIIYLAHLFDINAFDQPGVETYKNEVRRLLQE